MVPDISIAMQTRQRPVQRGTRKKAAAQTGLNASNPQTTPPHPGHPREIRIQPQIRMAREKIEFCPKPREPAKPGKIITAVEAIGYQTRPLDNEARPSPATKAPSTIRICRTRYAT